MQHTGCSTRIQEMRNSVLAKIVPKCRESHSMQKSCGCHLVSDFSSEMYFSSSAFQEPLSWEVPCFRSNGRHAEERADCTMQTLAPTQGLHLLH